ncbi:MAG: helicase c2, partial [Nitrospirae bacterium]|nr:helicase c2 [Nitrospirota bacterium]
TKLSGLLGKIYSASGDEDEKKEVIAVMNRCEACINSLKAILMQELEGHVYWAERDGKIVRLAATPIELAELLKTAVFDNLKSGILTSATLAVNNNFTYIKERLGLQEAEEILLKSPFNYKEHAVLYIAGDLPEPKAKDFEEKFIDRLKAIIEITGGRTLVLFTSYSLLNKAYDAIDMEGVNILKQGDADSYRLIQMFKEDDNSVLFGTYTFWQGIDVPGDDLQCVVITKLPFAVPDEPVTEARMEALQAEDKDPFSHYQIPQAAILFKQGFGRLIRNKTDRGIVAVLDSRVRTKRYGMQFLNSLPECRKTVSLDDVRSFYITVSNMGTRREVKKTLSQRS